MSENKIYGAEKEISEIIKTIEEKFASGNKDAQPNSIFIDGESGTGKTTILENIKEHFGKLSIRFIDIYDLVDRELMIRPQKPTVFTLDQLDRLEELGFAEEDLQNFLENFSKLVENGKGIVIGLGDSSKVFPEIIDFFDKRIKIPFPDEEARKEIIKSALKDINLNEKEVEDIAKMTYGIPGGEIIVMCKEAHRKSTNHTIDVNDFANEVKLYNNKNNKIGRHDWDNLGGLKNIIEEIKKDVIEPLEYSNYYNEYNLDLPKGILLYGPPGTGKTTIAKILANESRFNFFSFSMSDVLNKFVGDSEKNISKYFKKARENSPSILFIDEIESIGSARDDGVNSKIYNSLINELLHQMDGINEIKNVVVIGATNFPELLDPALVRPGRFDKSYEIPLPDEEGRKEILKIYINKFNLRKELSDENAMIDYLANETDLFSGADIMQLCKNAGKEFAHTNIMRKEFNKPNNETGAEIFERVLSKMKKDKDQKNEHKEVGFIKHTEIKKFKNMLRLANALEKSKEIR